MLKMDINNLREKCEEAGQGHLLQFWEQLNEDQQKALIFDISQINLQVRECVSLCEAGLHK